jgi:protein-S-isoprenylcysteine O-methyltransferase Ste14
MQISHLWIFYLLAYAIAFPLRQWANAKRGEPIEDPQMLRQHKGVVAGALLWMLAGFVISLFVPILVRPLFFVGLVFYVFGLGIAAFAFCSFANQRGLVTGVLYRYSRNPNYVGWMLLILGLTLMGWTTSIWSFMFLVYFIVTIPYFHWTILLEERYLAERHGDSYRQYLAGTPRYMRLPKK